jgi:ATP-binding cassette subfamily B protein
VEALESAFSGSRIVVGFGMEKAQEGLFDRVLVDREHAEKRVVVLQAVMEGVFALVNQTGLVIVLFLGGWFVLNDPNFTLGDFYAFVAYLSGLTNPLWTIAWFFVSTNVANTSIKRMQELELEEERPAGDETLTEQQPALAIEHLGFAYADNGGASVLRDVSLTVRPGETVALVGPVGCGKSTLIECAVGLLEPDAGTVALGDTPLFELSDAERARHLAYAPQEPLLFSGGVDLNVTLGRTLEPATVESSLRTACLDEEVALDHEVAQGGKGLSGGQRARVSLARAIAGAPKVLVLDDVTSALDALTEQRFWNQIRAQLPDTAILVSTHREATAQRADRVLWLQDGVILHEGLHEQLVATEAGYQQLFALE